MASLYADENFPLPVVEALRALGHDVLTMLEDDTANQALPDPQVLSVATNKGRAVLTMNRLHFKRLHGRQSSHAGIVVCTFDPDFVGQARRIHEALATVRELGGQLISIYRPAKRHPVQEL